MMKKILCLLAAALLCCLSGTAPAEEAAAVTAAELDALLAGVRAEALSSELLNDPTAEDARREDGIYLQYPVAWIFAEDTRLAEDTPVNALVFSDSEGFVFRSTGIDTQVLDLLAAFPNMNPDLAGTREEALLYLQETEGGNSTEIRSMNNTAMTSQCSSERKS